MGTQGLVTFRQDRQVLAKVTVAHDGAMAFRFAEAVRNVQDDTIYTDPQALAGIAAQIKFGCDKCIVVATRDGCFSPTNEMPSSDYVDRAARTFDDEIFNPRWDRGTADYILVVQI